MRAYLCGEKAGTNPFLFLPALEHLTSEVELVSAEEADFLFVTHKPRSFRELFSIYDRGQIRIFVGREAISPDLNLFDYAITFDSSVQSDRLFRPHPVIFFSHDLRFGDLEAGRKITVDEYIDRPHFCDFIYRNEWGASERESLFRWMQAQFGGVRSYGSFLNNADIADLGNEEELSSSDWRVQKIAVQQRHRFSLALENASFSGYTSEKLLTSLMAGSIPIYWGNPRVEEEFNAKRFLVFDGSNHEELSKRIRELVNAPELAVATLHEPVFTEAQKARIDVNALELERWVSKFFESKVLSLRHRPHGWYSDWYSGMIRRAYYREKWSRSRWKSYFGKLLSDSHE